MCAGPNLKDLQTPDSKALQTKNRPPDQVYADPIMFKLKNSEKCLNNKLFHADWHPIHHQGRVHYCHMVMTMPIEDATAEVSCPGFLVTAKMGEVLARKKGCAGGAKFAIQKKSAEAELRDCEAKEQSAAHDKNYDAAKEWQAKADILRAKIAGMKSAVEAEKAAMGALGTSFHSTWKTRADATSQEQLSAEAAKEGEKPAEAAKEGENPAAAAVLETPSPNPNPAEPKKPASPNPASQKSAAPQVVTPEPKSGAGKISAESETKAAKAEKKTTTTKTSGKKTTKPAKKTSPKGEKEEKEKEKEKEKDKDKDKEEKKDREMEMKAKKRSGKEKEKEGKKRSRESSDEESSSESTPKKKKKKSK